MQGLRYVADYFFRYRMLVDLGNYGVFIIVYHLQSKAEVIDVALRCLMWQAMLDPGIFPIDEVFNTTSTLADKFLGD